MSVTAMKVEDLSVGLKSSEPAWYSPNKSNVDAVVGFVATRQF